MRIKRIDPAGNPADLAAVLPAIRAAHAGFVPGEPAPCGQRVRQWTGPQDQRESVCFAAFASGSDVSGASVSEASRASEASEIPERSGVGPAVGVTMGGHATQDPDLFGTWSFISPSVAGPEVAAALMDQVSEYCLARHIGRILVNTAVNADAARYAPQRGATPSFAGMRPVLDLPSTDADTFARLAEPSAANSRYTLVDWTDACPDHLADAYAAAGDAMNDAPPEASDLAKPVRDRQRLRAAEAAWTRQGVRMLVTAAVAPDGAVGGFTMTALYPEQPEFAEVWDTGVARDHRGHSLGVRLKAAATLRLVREHRAVRQVYTFTAQDNAPMIAVNRRLGYRDVAGWEMFVHEVKG
jgi:GNAT superfamily N-acetyltransferase